MKVGDKVIRSQTFPVRYENGKWVNETIEYEVRIMSIAEGYAMVRRKRCLPFACSVEELLEIKNGN
jgi:hypothetical protein